MLPHQQRQALSQVEHGGGVSLASKVLHANRLVCPSIGARPIVALLELLDARLQGVGGHVQGRQSPEGQAGR